MANDDRAILAHVEGESEILEDTGTDTWDSPLPGESALHFSRFREWLVSGQTVTDWGRNHPELAKDTVRTLAARHRWIARKAYMEIRHSETKIQRTEEAAQAYLQGWIDMVEWGKEEVARMRAEGVRLTPKEVVAMFKAATEAINAMKGQNNPLDAPEDATPEEIQNMLDLVNGLGGGKK